MNNVIKDYDRAEEYFKKSIKADPNSSNNQMLFGFFQFKTGKLDLAKEMLLKSIELGSLDYGNMNLGLVYLAEKEDKKALVALKKSIDNFDDIDVFLKGFDEDYQDLKQYKVSQNKYKEIKKKLLEYIKT